MAIIYFDASAFVKLVVAEDGADIAADLWDSCDLAVSSRLAYPEVRAALAAAARNHRLTNDDLGRAEDDFEEYWEAVSVVELSTNVGQQAGQLAKMHSLRGADSVHLSSALAVPDVDLVVAAWDRQLQRGARAAGLRVAPADLLTT